MNSHSFPKRHIVDGDELKRRRLYMPQSRYSKPAHAKQKLPDCQGSAVTVVRRRGPVNSSKLAVLRQKSLYASRISSLHLELSVGTYNCNDCFRCKTC